ncbi:MAG TPA: polymorphic toxin-type HINT domain-containing protein, partial [Armatimonadota bacterium]|nr:polymorphic toxin-type HINT domain-containing protein [Armatimonadota bacterium]
RGNWASETATNPIPDYTGTNTYQYDNLSRLTSEQTTKVGGAGFSYSYDNAGNVVSMNGTPYTYDPDNLLTGAGFGNDSRGNQYVDFGMGFGLDEENLVGTIASIDAFYWDGLNRRVAKWDTQNGDYTGYYYDGNQPAIETNVSSGAVTAVDVVGANGLASRWDNVSNSQVYYQFDPAGNTAERLDGAGNVLYAGSTFAYGASYFVGSQSQDPYAGFAGQWGGSLIYETGGEFLGPRFYDVNLGRFISRDPVGYAAGPNLYTYGGGNPLTNPDFSGLDWLNTGANFFGGAGHILTCGLTDRIRGWLGFNGGVDKCSEAYRAGEVAGAVEGVALIAAAPVAAAEIADVEGEEGAAEGIESLADGADEGAAESETSADADSAPESPDGPKCFVAGTPVQMADGTTKPIEKVNKGDLVWTRNSSNGKTEIKPVLNVSKHTAYDLITIQTGASVTGRAEDSITGTPGHPFFTPGGEKVPMGDLRVGQQIVSRDGATVVVQAKTSRHVEEGISVYNLTVEDDHTYFVGTADGGDWVHNTCRIYGDGTRSGFAGRSPRLPESIDPGPARTDIIWDDTEEGPRIFRARTYDETGTRVRDFDFARKGNDGPFPHSHDWEPNPTGGAARRGPSIPFPDAWPE